MLHIYQKWKTDYIFIIQEKKSSQILEKNLSVHS